MVETQKSLTWFDAAGRGFKSQSACQCLTHVNTYDSLGRTVKSAVLGKDNTLLQETEHVYDHAGNVVQTIKVELSATSKKGFSRKQFSANWYDPMGRPVANAQFGTNGGKTYLWGAVQDELLTVDDDWTLRDHLNTVRKVINAKGKMISHLEYNAFGALQNATGDKVLFRYTGKMFDDATGLQWNINRWYDANVGRWISEDPIEFRGRDANLARYVKNISVQNIDLYGFQSISQSHQTKWINLATDLSNWIRDLIGWDQVIASGHYLKVSGESSDGCTFYSYFKDSAEGLWTFAYFPATYKLTVSDPIEKKKKSPDSGCPCSEVDCVTYTSEYVGYLGIKTSIIDISLTLATSTISIVICADGYTKVTENRNP
jgi:RHS repeat-associated protein